MLSDQCVICIHYRSEWKCDAYPRKIPKIIIDGVHDHRKPFKGDNGIRQETIKI